MSELGIDGARDDLRVDLLKLSHSVTECDDFSGAHKSTASKIYHAETDICYHVMALINQDKRIPTKYLFSPGLQRGHIFLALCIYKLLKM